MTRIIVQPQIARRGERGTVTSVLLIMTSLLLISGAAFLGIEQRQARMVRQTTAHIQAKYYAEQAARKAIWRIGNTAPDYWRTWATFSDSTSSASFDSTTNRVTAIGRFGGVTDTIRVLVNLDPVPSSEINHVIAYQTSYKTSGSGGTLTYPAGYGPHQIAQVPALDINYYRDNANFTYTGNQTFNTTLANGIHFVEGNVTAKTGTTLTGSLIATGTIKFQGQVTVTAAQVPSTSPYYPAYYPAVASMDTTEATLSVSGDTQHLNISGLLYARGEVDLNPAQVTGAIISKSVELGGSYAVTYDAKYGPPPPGLVLWPSSYKPSIGAWIE